jgi:hypothetical protein
MRAPYRPNGSVNAELYLKTLFVRIYKWRTIFPFLGPRFFGARVWPRTGRQPGSGVVLKPDRVRPKRRISVKENDFAN